MGHMLSVFYNSVQMQHPNRVALPWFIFSTLKRDFVFWNSLSSCGLSFERSRFTIDHADLVDVYDLEKSGYDKKFKFHKCVSGKMENIVFVGRSSNLRRRMKDEADFVERLRKHTGYDIQYIPNMGSLSLFDQAQTYHNAKAVISMHGAQLAFSMFSLPESTIIELVPCTNTYCAKWIHREHSPSTNWHYINGYGIKSEKSVRYPRDMIMNWDQNTLNEITDILSKIIH